ncbi:MAG: prolyl oligopeptidase family serine peptidase [Planctomycetota bacterium]
MNRLNIATTWGLDSAESSGHDSSLPSDAGNGSDASSLFTTYRPATQAHTCFVPVHYEANYAYPLIVWLHSDGFNENQVGQVMPHVSMRNYLATGIRAPKAADSAGHRFCWGESTAVMESTEFSVMEAIRHAMEQYSVNPNRVVIAGYKEGGTVAMQIAMRHPERFSGVVNIGGRFDVPDATLVDRSALCKHRLRMLWQHAMLAEDFDQALLTEQVKLASKFRPRLEVRQYRSDDEMNTAVLSDFDRWVMQFIVNEASDPTCLWDSSPTAFSDN